MTSLVPPTKHKIPYTYVEVIWEDATAHNESWVNVADEDVCPELVCTRGWLVKEKPTYVSVASSVAADEAGDANLVGNVATIPRGMIKQMREIRAVSVGKKKIKETE